MRYFVVELSKEVKSTKLMEQEKESLLDVGEFINEYAAFMMGCGIHTSRVIRSAKRIVESYGYLISISIFQKNIILNLRDKNTHEYYTGVVEIPALPINFEFNSELSALSWETFDNHLSLADLRKKFQKITATPPLNRYIVLILVGLANASFCRLFGGDWVSTAIVLIATLIGFYLRQRLTRTSLNHYVIFITTAFVSSICAASSIWFDTTSDIALATSVLFLVPGVPLINGVIDIVEGHTLTGFGRLTQAALLIVCIAIGLSFTLLMVKSRLL